MKKILLVAMTLLLSASVAFGAIASGMDLVDVFAKNQLGFGDDADIEYNARLYGIFGTEKLRFTVNILELANSFFNNGQTENSMPVVYGLPRFFVGAGYKINDAHRVAIGYGMNKKWDRTEEGTPGWLGHDVSVFYQGAFGGNTIRFATPIQFGNGTGTYTETDPITSEEKTKKLSDKISGLYIAPQVRWLGKAGALTQIRFAVPYHAYKYKDEGPADANGDPTDQVSTSIGVDLRAYFSLATDPVSVSLVPRVIYETAIEGDKATPQAVVGGDRKYQAFDSEAEIDGFSFEKPWNLSTRLELSLGAGNDIVSVWAGPQLRWNAKGAPKMSKTIARGTGTFVNDLSKPVNDDSGNHIGYLEKEETETVEVIRKEAFQSFGYTLPIEVTIKPSANLAFDLGASYSGLAWSGAPKANSDKVFKFDAKVTWYF